ncbi:transcriptional regulator [Sphingosinicellaceae bacterium]|nr:transcriptional regulator [Sphingosinicellaceae bacterium]
MTHPDFESIMQGLAEAKAYMNGAREGYVTHYPPPTVDVRAVRRKTKRTQQGFAAHYGFSVGAVRDWEQGRRQPERAARILLAMIEREPDIVERTLRSVG